MCQRSCRESYYHCRVRTISALVLAIALVNGAVATRTAPAPGSLTIDQLIDIKHPSNPLWSHDGRRIAFSWERAGIASLYVVPADGSRSASAVTTDGSPTGNVFWGADGALYFTRGGTLMKTMADGTAPSPVLPNAAARAVAPSRDGSRVAYLAGAQPTEVHVRLLAGGADTVAARLTERLTSVAWIDSDHLALSSGGAGRTIRHEQTPDYSGSKIIYTITERVPGPPGDTYVLAIGGGAPVKSAAPMPPAFGARGSRWIDPSHFLVDRQSADFKRRSIHVISTTGEDRLVHEDVKQTFWSMTGDARGGSQASPDGKWILFLSDQDGWDQIYVAPASGGAAVQITKGQFEAWRPSWSPDSTRIAFDSNEGPNPGSRHLGLVSLNGDPSRATVTTITAGRGTDTDPQWSPDGRRLVYQHTDPQNSADLFVVDAKAGAEPARLTDSMPPAIDRSAFVEPQLVHYAGPDGRQVPAYLFVPKTLDRSRKHPAIVWVHGDGVNQNYDGWHVQRNYAVYYSFHQHLLQQGYVVIAPDYRGSIGYGSAWREGVYMDVGGKDFRDAAMSADYLKTLPYVDADRIGIWGLSYGGFFTLLAVTEMPTTFRAAVDVAGVADYAMYYEDPYHGGWTASRIGTPEENPKVYAQASPLSHVDRVARPLLILHGTADVNVPYLHSVRLIDALLKSKKGPLTEFMMYPGEFHYFTREHVLRDAWTRVDDFFRKWLKP
jgi:dipeptidyl aminopeptidase/acylaminoacyl peptidase